MTRLLAEVLLWLGGLSRVGVTIVIVDEHQGRTGLLSNLGKLYPEMDQHELMVDSLKFAIDMVTEKVR